MEAVKEITVWSDGSAYNHTYLLDGDSMIAYLKFGKGEPYYFNKPIRISRSGRKFERLTVNPFEVVVPTALVEVEGSKGNVYYVNPEDKTCTCPGYTFRGSCKHTKDL